MADPGHAPAGPAEPVDWYKRREDLLTLNRRIGRLACSEEERTADQLAKLAAQSDPLRLNPRGFDPKTLRLRQVAGGAQALEGELSSVAVSPIVSTSERAWRRTQSTHQAEKAAINFAATFEVRNAPHQLCHRTAKSCRAGEAGPSGT
jgi:hypothetical protein